MTTNGSVDIDDEHAVSFAVRRLRVIADELETVKAHTKALYEERRRLVYELRGTVSQNDLAMACKCGVDMIKNIVGSARPKQDSDRGTV